MTRLLYALGVIASSAGILTGIDALPSGPAAPTPALASPTPATPVMIGADKPVYLGRMVVTAAPLPGGAAR